MKPCNNLTVSTPEAAKIIGVTYRKLDHWLRSGLITCTQEANGRGSRRRWSVEDVTRAAFIHELSEKGPSVRHIREMREKGKFSDDELNTACNVGANNLPVTIYVIDKVVYAIASEALRIDFSARDQLLPVVYLHTRTADIRRKMEALHNSEQGEIDDT